MPVDVMEETYYLTTSGWNTKKPTDASCIIEAWDLDVYWAVGWDEEYHHWTCMWVTDDPRWNLTNRNALRAKYPLPDTTEGRVNCAASAGWPLVENRSVLVGAA